MLAGTTSSLSIAELGAALPQPRRFIGMHFFNPVPASKPVEVVTTPEAALEVVEQVRGWVRGLAETDVVVRDSPGFATSRLGVLLGLEAIRICWAATKSRPMTSAGCAAFADSAGVAAGPSVPVARRFQVCRPV